MSCVQHAIATGAQHPNSSGAIAEAAAAAATAAASLVSADAQELAALPAAAWGSLETGREHIRAAQSAAVAAIHNRGTADRSGKSSANGGSTDAGGGGRFAGLVPGHGLAIGEGQQQLSEGGWLSATTQGMAASLWRSVIRFDCSSRTYLRWASSFTSGC